MAVYGTFLRTLAQEALDGRSWRAALLTEAYAQNIDTHAFWSQVSLYAIGASVVITPELSYDSTSNAVLLTVDNNRINFGARTHDGIGAVVIYAWTGMAATSPLFSVDIFEEPAESSGEEFIYSIPDEGLIRFSIQT